MIKKIIAIFMMCCLLFSVISIAVNAAQEETLAPRWNNTTYITAKLIFTGTTGNVSVSVVGESSVSNITADVKLYYKNTSGRWVEDPKNWDYDVNQSWLTISETFSGTAGLEYKIEVDGIVTKNGSTESISDTSTAICPTP